MNECFGFSAWVRIKEAVLPLFVVLWADTLIERDWPGIAPVARTR